MRTRRTKSRGAKPPLTDADLHKLLKEPHPAWNDRVKMTRWLAQEFIADHCEEFGVPLEPKATLEMLRQPHGSLTGGSYMPGRAGRLVRAVLSRVPIDVDLVALIVDQLELIETLEGMANERRKPSGRRTPLAWMLTEIAAQDGMAVDEPQLAGRIELFDGVCDLWRIREIEIRGKKVVKSGGQRRVHGEVWASVNEAVAKLGQFSRVAEVARKPKIGALRSYSLREPQQKLLRSPG